MSVITLPWSMEQDRQNQIKANSVHVDDNFNTLLNAVNNKLEKDGSVIPTADLPMGSHKITGLATPTASGDAATKGYVDTLTTTLGATYVKLTGDQTIAGTKTFSSTISGSITGNAGTVTNGVYTSGNQTIGGTKTFSASPVVPTVTASDNSTKSASTAFVNSFLRRSFSKNQPTLTKLTADGDITGGDITLLQSFLNFDQLLIYLGTDESDSNTAITMPTWELDWLLTNTISGKSILLGITGQAQRVHSAYIDQTVQGSGYWVVKPYTDGSTNTFLKGAYENCIIHGIWGFNL